MRSSLKHPAEGGRTGVRKDGHPGPCSMALAKVCPYPHISGQKFARALRCAAPPSPLPTPTHGASRDAGGHPLGGPVPPPSSSLRARLQPGDESAASVEKENPEEPGTPLAGCCLGWKPGRLGWGGPLERQGSHQHLSPPPTPRWLRWLRQSQREPDLKGQPPPRLQAELRGDGTCPTPAPRLHCWP